MSKIVEVAAAVMLRAGGTEFLLAQRPEGKVYAGYWEFPGGKVEPGESVRDALIRELQEELGITVTACSPWLTRQFTYPHATVRLNFWRVTAYKESFGFDAPPFTYADFEESDVLVFIGANPCIAHPIMWQRVLKNQRSPEIIVVEH